MSVDSPAAPAVSSDLRLYLALRFMGALAMQVQIVVIGWHVYAISNDPFALGLIGLFQFLAMVVVVLPAGDAADRIDRRRILFGVYAMQTMASATLVYLIFTGEQALWPFFMVAGMFGIAQAFAGPAMQSLLPFLVPSGMLPRAIALGSTMWQTATIAGPALGGWLYALDPSAPFAVALFLFAVCAGGIGWLRPRRIAEPEREGTTLARVAEGIRYVKKNPIVLGAISMDMIAVLLGGTTALLPIFARDILQVGEIGLGFLRSAPSVGAAIVAIAFARWPMTRNVGLNMFACVAVFGLATVVFGVSQNFALSLVALAILGGADQVSVVIRSTLVQLATPDPMRGRVSAVNFLFIGTSNELGEFRSGVTAGWFGVVPAVVLGGIGTLAVVAAWLKLFPSLRRIDRFSDAMEGVEPTPTSREKLLQG
jgi:MFS family permease